MKVNLMGRIGSNKGWKKKNKKKRIKKKSGVKEMKEKIGETKEEIL